MSSENNKRPWYGVNLGNWLLLEPWMKRSLFHSTQAIDEYSLCQVLGQGAEAFMTRHRETYIQEDDFRWLRDQGINAVRIPYGYWIVDSGSSEPFISGIEYLDQAIRWCEQYGVAAILDLHGAPGHQNTADHSGRVEHWQWHRDTAHQARTLDILEAVAERYKGSPAVEGISLLNEPNQTIDPSLLLEFYQAGYARVRRHMPATVAVIVEAYPNSTLPLFHGRTVGENVITDAHFYQYFGDEFSVMAIEDHLAFPVTRVLPRLRDFSLAGPLIIGEWSLAMGNQTALSSLSPARRATAQRAFAETQKYAYSESAGSFFWSYKVEDCLEWSFRDAAEHGLFPGRLFPGSLDNSL